MELVTKEATMTSLEISELVESRHDKVKQSIERLAVRGVIELPPMGEIKTATKPTQAYVVDKRSSYIIVAQLSPEFTARLVDRWQELESGLQKTALPQDYPAALRMLANEVELKELAFKQRDEAIKTKAYISDKKTATALNTASQSSKKVKKLEIKLDESKKYCTIKRMSMLYHGQKFKFAKLRKASESMGLPSVDVFDANYGSVKAYHVDVWSEVYSVTVEGI